MTLVKICGITNLEDALDCANAGADLLGFNFYRASPRYISPEDARRIIDQLPESVVSVGIFVNEETPDDVKRSADTARVAAVQLHGEESPAYCEALRELFVIKAFRVNDTFDPEVAGAFPSQAVLLDGFDTAVRGGSGKTFDWSLASFTIRLVPRLFLAGGLAPENVFEAVAAVRPYAVDACSSLENFPGRKDLTRVRQFLAEVRRVNTR